MITSIPINNSEKKGINDKDGMIIINAIYFSDIWKNKFKKENTFKTDFVNYLKNKTKNEIKVDMMKIVDKYLYSESSTNQTIAMDYVSDFCMLVDLPKEIIKPTLMTQKEIIKLYNSMEIEEVDLYFPKFTYENKHNLLQNIIDSGFDITGTEYDPMIKDRKDKIYIKDIIQITKIVSDEEGTKATAVTEIIFGNKAVMKKEIIFKADHSFAFYIIHKPSFEILFTGVFNG
jgi:serpin B